MVHGATYAPTPHRIDFHIQMALTANLGMYLGHTNVSNAFAEAEHPKQMYYMRYDTVFRDWWKRTHPDTTVPPDAIVPVLKNVQGRPEGPRIWVVRCHIILVALKLKSTPHALYLYHGTFNNEFVLFLHIVDDFSIVCVLEEMYILLCDKLDLNWQVPMSRYGMMKHFNGSDISQSTTHISISSKSTSTPSSKLRVGRYCTNILTRESI
jgi:hypothetical protein